MTLSRRSILALGATALGFGAIAGGMGYYLRRAPLAFEALSNPQGFRRLKTAPGGLSSFIAGFDGVPDAPLSAERLCDIAFRGKGQKAGEVVIAAFSDFFCPYCRVLDKQLHDLAQSDAQVTLVSHQVPLLGRPSVMAARGAIAAERQGAYAAYFKRMIRTTFVPNPAYLRDFAQSEGLDVAQFEADFASAETDRLLESAAQAFRAFGFVGTPGLVIGRTLVNGVIAPRALRALIALEKAQEGAC